MNESWKRRGCSRAHIFNPTGDILIVITAVSIQGTEKMYFNESFEQENAITDVKETAKNYESETFKPAVIFFR